jgi:hypothetical protein
LPYLATMFGLSTASEVEMLAMSRRFRSSADGHRFGSCHISSQRYPAAFCEVLLAGVLMFRHAGCTSTALAGQVRMPADSWQPRCHWTPADAGARKRWRCACKHLPQRLNRRMRTPEFCRNHLPFRGRSKSASPNALGASILVKRHEIIKKFGAVPQVRLTQPTVHTSDSTLRTHTVL